MGTKDDFKMAVKLTIDVNFYKKVICTAFLNLQLVFFYQKKIGAKTDCKMLVKLYSGSF